MIKNYKNLLAVAAMLGLGLTTAVQAASVLTPAQKALSDKVYNSATKAKGNFSEVFKVNGLADQLVKTVPATNSAATSEALTTLKNRVNAAVQTPAELTRSNYTLLQNFMKKYASLKSNPSFKGLETSVTNFFRQAK